MADPDRFDKLAERAIHAFYFRRQQGKSLTALWATDALDELGSRRTAMEDRIADFAFKWMPDTKDLAARLRRHGDHATVDFHSAGGELFAMAQAELREYLIQEGTPADMAEKASSITVGGVLREEYADRYVPPS